MPEDGHDASPWHFRCGEHDPHSSVMHYRVADGLFLVPFSGEGTYLAPIGNDRAWRTASSDDERFQDWASCNVSFEGALFRITACERCGS
jgi:hypothetical protein